MSEVICEICKGWYPSYNRTGIKFKADLAHVVGNNECVAAAWNKHKEGLADYFAEAVRLSNLTTTMHSLRQI